MAAKLVCEYYARDLRAGHLPLKDRIKLRRGIAVYDDGQVWGTYEWRPAVLAVVKVYMRTRHPVRWRRAVEAKRNRRRFGLA